MSTSWKDFVDAFRIGSETGNIEKLSNIIAEDLIGLLLTWIDKLHYRGLRQPLLE